MLHFSVGPIIAAARRHYSRCVVGLTTVRPTPNSSHSLIMVSFQQFLLDSQFLYRFLAPSMGLAIEFTTFASRPAPKLGLRPILDVFIAKKLSPKMWVVTNGPTLTQPFVDRFTSGFHYFVPEWS